MATEEEKAEKARSEKFSDSEFTIEDEPEYDVAWAFAFMNGLPEPPVLRELDN